MEPPAVRALRVLVALGVGCSLALGVCPAYAGLGGDTGSIQDDVQAWHGTRTVTPGVIGAARWELHEIRLADGLVIHEYLGAHGAVFAVAWSGSHMPDLRRLFGRSFDDYVAMAREHRGDHHHMEVSGPGLHVQSAGHFHTFAGRAWLPGALPVGFDPGMLR